MLERLLQSWAVASRKTQYKKKSELATQLQNLNDEDPYEDRLIEIMDVKLALNLEADKEEIY